MKLVGNFKIINCKKTIIQMLNILIFSHQVTTERGSKEKLGQMRAAIHAYNETFI